MNINIIKAVTTDQKKLLCSLIYDVHQRLITKGHPLWDEDALQPQALLIDESVGYIGYADMTPCSTMILCNTDKKYWDDTEGQIALYLHKLTVANGFGGKNIPKMMVDYAKTLAKQKGYHKLRLDCRSERDYLVNLYQSLGFNIVGYKKLPNQTNVLFEIQL